MKKILLSALLFLSYSLQSQSYNLTFDNTFGTNGIKTSNMYTDPSMNFAPKKCLLINGKYFFLSNKIAKFHYNGDLDTSFGSNGFFTIGNVTDVYNILGFKSVNNAIYLFGEIVTNSNSDGFIAKINEDGILDSGFGINGVSRIDFGSNETIKNFSLDANGNLYCIGTKLTDTTDASSSRLFHFKLNADGSLNNSFDANGYKQFLLNDYTTGEAIFNDGSNFLLVGTSTYYVNTTIIRKLLITKMDNNGNVIPAFGTNGSTVIELYSGMHINLSDVELAGNKLYVSYFYLWSFATRGKQIAKYDLSTNQTVFNRSIYFNSTFQVENTDDLYVVGSERCNPYSCFRNFSFSKLRADGTSDPYFGNDGEYQYNFPAEPFSRDDISTVMLKEDNGKILLAGYSSATIWVNNFPTYEKGFTMMRLVQGALNVTDNIKNEATIYPNPFTDFITIETSEHIRQIELMDVNGRVLDKLVANNVENATTVPLPNLNRGLYFIKITTENGKTITKKIVKQ